MNGSMRTTLFRLYVAVIALLVSLTSASAQAPQEKPNANAPQRESETLQLLNARIEKLESLIEQQQRTLIEMQRRLDEVNGTARIVPASSSRSEGAGEVASVLHSPSVETAQPLKTTTAVSQSKPQDKAPSVAGWGKDHAFLRSEDGAFETQIGGYGQLDFRGYGSGDHPPNTFLLRRARISLEGKLQRYFDFRIEGDFADTATALRDMYVNIHRIDEFQVRFGQFRVPISQEEMRSDNLQDFVERSLVNNLVPSRSPGVGVSGSIDKGVFEYQLGAWNGKGLLAANNNGTPESALRVRFNPWKHSEAFLAKGFIFGGAVTQGRSAGGLSVRGLTESRSFTFFTPDTINGKYTRANAEMTWMLGPAAIRAEYDQTNQRRDNLGPGGRNLPGVVAKGYLAQMTYLLTGEEKPEVGIVAPRNNLFSDGSGRQGLGAWELKFRYANLQIADGTPKSNRAETFFFGTNWYMNRYVRYVLDLGIERFKDVARTPRPGDSNLFVVLSRIQVAF
jgi:phosphate-selective porin OprO/OprP